METIDLSKAKVGDKFRTRNGQILEYIGENFRYRDDKYKFIDEQGIVKYFNQYGNYLIGEENELDLIVKVPNKPLDELIEEATKKIRENDDAIAEENELQRRQEVVELAEKLFIRGTMKDWFYKLIQNNKAKTTYVEYIFAYAEEFVSTREKYLKKGGGKL